jgi:hypothetical protein
MSNSRRSKTVLKVFPFRATDGTPAASREIEALFMVSELQGFSKANFVGNALLDEREGYFLEKPSAETDMNVATPAWTTPRLRVFA